MGSERFSNISSPTCRQSTPSLKAFLLLPEDLDLEGGLDSGRLLQGEVGASEFWFLDVGGGVVVGGSVAGIDEGVTGVLIGVEGVGGSMFMGSTSVRSGVSTTGVVGVEREISGVGRSWTGVLGGAV